jgi:adenylate cyclase
MAEERVERRLTAILAGDVAGYSRLMGADEEGTLKRLHTGASSWNPRSRNIAVASSSGQATES